MTKVKSTAELLNRVKEILQEIPSVIPYVKFAFLEDQLFKKPVSNSILIEPLGESISPNGISLAHPLKETKGFIIHYLFKSMTPDLHMIPFVEKKDEIINKLLDERMIGIEGLFLNYSIQTEHYKFTTDEVGEEIWVVKIIFKGQYR